MSIVCKVEGVPRPTLSWTKEDKEVVPDQRHLLEVLGDTVILKIPQCSVDDEATYVLKVENPAGSDTVAIPLKVEGRCLLLQRFYIHAYWLFNMKEGPFDDSFIFNLQYTNSSVVDCKY